MTLEKRAKFVKIVSIILITYALLWGLAPYTNINLPARFILDASDWPIDKMAQPLTRDVMWLTAIAAGLLGAVSTFFYGIVAPAVARNDRAIIRTTIIAMLFWYFVDSFGSIASGVFFNAVLNTVYLVLMLAPLIGIKSKAS